MGADNEMNYQITIEKSSKMVYNGGCNMEENGKYTRRVVPNHNWERISINYPSLQRNLPFVPAQIIHDKERVGTMYTLDFTVIYDDFQGRIITDEKIIVGGKEIPVRAGWDTGSTYSCISKEFIEKYGLIPIGNDQLHSAYGTNNSGVYDIDILIHNTKIFNSTASMQPYIHADNVDLLIGMDVITEGDFRIYNSNGKICFSFKTE